MYKDFKNPLFKFESIPFYIYGEAIGVHLRSNLGIISRPGIICGPVDLETRSRKTMKSYSYLIKHQLLTAEVDIKSWL